ncbi:15432_t:CDS:2, partial [Racocetra persica]
GLLGLWMMLWGVWALDGALGFGWFALSFGALDSSLWALMVLWGFWMYLHPSNLVILISGYLVVSASTSEHLVISASAPKHLVASVSTSRHLVASISAPAPARDSLEKQVQQLERLFYELESCVMEFEKQKRRK